MIKRFVIICLSLVLLLVLSTAGGNAAVRFGVSMFQANAAKPNIAEFGVLKYASPTVGDLFSNVTGPAVKLTIDNTTGPTTVFRIKASVFYNNQKLASVVFGQWSQPLGVEVLGGTTRVMQLDPSGLDATEVIGKVREDSDNLKQYLGDFKTLDVVDDYFNDNVLSAKQLENAFITRNTLPNGKYKIEISLLKKLDSGQFEQVATHLETFDILETSLTPISPRGVQGDNIPTALTFDLVGFPTQVKCFHAVAEIAEGGKRIWTSQDVTIGVSGCRQAPINDLATVTIDIPSTVQFIGGLEYAWDVRIKDAVGKTVVLSSQTTFKLDNHAPVVSIEGTSGSVSDGMILHQDEVLVFEAYVNDREDEQRGLSPKLEWRVQEPGQSQSARVGNLRTLAYSFRKAGTYQVELYATDSFGLVTKQPLRVEVSSNQIPQLQVKSVGYKRNGQTRDVAWTLSGQSIQLAKYVFKPDDQLVIRLGVTDADNDSVNVVFRDKQVVAYADQVQGNGTVEAIISLTRLSAYNFNITATDARTGSSTLQFNQVRVVPGSTPRVTILAPIQGSKVVAGSTISLSAMAEDADDQNPIISWFRVNGTNDLEFIGSGSNLPYLVSEGSNVIRAEVTAQDPDTGVAKTEKGVAQVTVQGYVVVNEKPVVQIAVPEGLTFVAPSSNSSRVLSLTAVASDSDGPADLTYAWFVNNVPVPGTGSQIDYRFDGVGEWAVKVTVSDSKDTTSAEVKVIVAKPATFAVSISTDGSNRELAQGAILAVQANYGNLPGVNVSWYLSGNSTDGLYAERLVAVGDAPNIKFADAGDFTLKLFAVDGDKRYGESVIKIHVIANNPPQVESLSWTIPAYAGDSLTMTTGSTASNDNKTAVLVVNDVDGEKIDEVRWFVGNKSVAYGESYTTTFTRPGTYIFAVEARDGRGGVGQGTLTVQVQRDQRPPVVTVNTPLQGSAVPTYQTVYLKGTAVDPEGNDRIVEQSWFVDGHKLAEGETSFVPLEERTYNIAYTAKDVAGNLGGASVSINAVRPRLAIASPLTGSTVQLVKGESGQPQATVSLSADMVDSHDGPNYTFSWYVTQEGQSEQLIAEYIGAATAQYTITTAGSFTFRVRAILNDVPGSLPIQAVAGLVALPPVLKAEGLDKTVAANVAPQVVDAWAASVADSENRRKSVEVGGRVRLYAVVEDPDNARALTVVWEENGIGIAAASREGNSNRYYADLQLSQLAKHTLTVVAVDEHGERAARQITLDVTLNQPPLIESVDIPAGIDQGKTVTVGAKVSDPEGQRVTVTWLLDGTIIDSSYVMGSGSVASQYVFPHPGTFTLTVWAIDANGSKAESSSRVLIAGTAEPIITSPAAPMNSMPIVSNPVQFISMNVPDTANIRWTSDKDGTLSEEESSFEANLSAGPHTITLWVNSIGTHVNVMVQDPVQPFTTVGVIVGWTGTPALERPSIVTRGIDGPNTTIRFQNGTQPENYSPAERTIYDVDVLRLKGRDSLLVRLSGTNTIKEYGKEADGKQIDTSGNVQ